MKLKPFKSLPFNSIALCSQVNNIFVEAEEWKKRNLSTRTMTFDLYLNISWNSILILWWTQYPIELPTAPIPLEFLVRIIETHSFDTSNWIDWAGITLKMHSNWTCDCFNRIFRYINSISCLKRFFSSMIAYKLSNTHLEQVCHFAC